MDQLFIGKQKNQFLGHFTFSLIFPGFQRRVGTPINPLTVLCASSEKAEGVSPLTLDGEGIRRAYQVSDLKFSFPSDGKKEKAF